MKTNRRSRSFEDWPRADQELWLAVIEVGDILEGGGSGAHWAPTTKDNTRKAYAYWLQWLSITGQLDPDSDPLDRITPERVADYIAYRQDELASLTTFVYILDLLRLAQAASERDWTWLKGVKNRLWARAHPERDKTSKIRHASDIFELGLDLMNEAEGVTCRYNPLAADIQYRDGLIIALLAARPVRLKNLTSIEIDRHLFKIDQTYWLVFEAQEVKNRRHIEVSLPQALTEYLDRYLSQYRPRLLGDAISDRLWISRWATSLSSNSIRHQLKQRTGDAFGKAITPHLFRDCAATSIAIDDPEHVRVAAAVLGHHCLSTTQKYYDQSRMLTAGRHYQSTVAAMRTETRRKGQPRASEI
jgi:integrase/recombinase XerD